MMSLFSTSTADHLVSPAAYDFDDLDARLTAILVQRRSLRCAMGIEALLLGTDAIAIEIARLQVTLSVVAWRCSGGSAAAAVLRSYRWTIEAAFHLADLEVELLDRELTAADAETFARRSAMSYACVVEPSFVDASTCDATYEERALLLDLETARVGVERVLTAIFDLV